jgi:hypothetical protein
MSVWFTSKPHVIKDGPQSFWESRGQRSPDISVNWIKSDPVMALNCTLVVPGSRIKRSLRFVDLVDLEIVSI